MIRISNVLKVAQVDLALEATTKEEAVARVLAMFRGDARVAEFDSLKNAVEQRSAAAIEHGQCGICIAHGRTDTLKELVLSAGRLASPLAVPEIGVPLRLVFVAGIPSAFRSDYLRVVGAIARICANPEQIQKLLGVREPSRFIELLDAQMNRY